MDKKKKRKRIMCMVLACMLVGSNVSTAYANPLLLLLGGEVARNVAMVGVVSLLGLTGVGVSGYIYENQDNYAEFGEKLVNDFENFCSQSAEWVSVTSSDIANWLSLVAEGTLNKADATYLALKDWIVDLVGEKSNTGIGNLGNAYTELDGEEVKKALSKINMTELISNTQRISVFKSTQYVKQGDFYISDNLSRLVDVKFNDCSYLLVLSQTYKGNPEMYGAYSYGATSDYKSDTGERCINGLPIFNTRVIANCPGFGGECLIGTNEFKGDYQVVIDGNRNDVMSQFSDYQSAFPYLGEIILASGVINCFPDWDFSLPNENSIAKDLVIDPNIDQVIERDGTLDNVDVVSVDGVQDTVIPVDWDGVQDISKPYPFPDVVPVDNVKGVVIGSDVPIEDIPTLDPTNPTNPTVPQQTGYTVSGLETVFPFCIPFDLVKIFTLFKAEPLAPKFNYTFTYYVSGNKKTENIDIDLSKFNSVAELLRTLELIAFMVALTLKTRDLIRG